MAKKKHKCPEEVSEKWAIPYADFLTLLLCLFIAMYAMSASKSESAATFFAQAFSKAFGMKVIPMEEVLPRQILPQPIIPKAQLTEKGKAIKRKLIELERMLKEYGLEGSIQIVYEAIGIRLILKDRVLFDSGSAELKPEYRPILDKIVEILKEIKNPVEVEGHTDSIPIHTSKYPSNWELSTARAGSVVRYFISKGLDPTRFKAVGYADTKPIAPNTTPEGREKNRRIEIVILNVKGAELTKIREHQGKQRTEK